MLLDAKICSEEGLNEISSTVIRSMYKPLHFIYAHGKLEEDLGTDIIYLNKGDYTLHDGLVAYTEEWKAVRFFLYKHPATFMLTGIVVYCDDTEAYKYGKQLIEEKPLRF